MTDTSTNPAAAQAAKIYDCIVIGAGLGGLSAALHLQQDGLRVALIERLARVGGLCGTCLHEGHEFVIACNDFGTGAVGILRKLGIPVRFERRRTRVLYDGAQYHLPPTAGTLMRLLPHLADLRRYLGSVREAHNGGQASDGGLDLELAVGRAVRDQRLADLLKLPAYLMGVAPHQLPVEALRHETDFRYGYWQPMVPLGGPQVMADAMAAEFSKRGDLFLSTDCLAIDTDGDLKAIRTSNGILRARDIVSTIERPADAPQRSGLHISMYWLVVDRRFPFPAGVHTLVHYPPGISQWFRALDCGMTPKQFGFHVFKSDLLPSSDEATMNVYFYQPRDGEGDRHFAERERYIFTELERMLPGIGRAIRHKYFVGPADFRRLHGLDGRVTPRLHRPGERKPANYDAASGLYRAGAGAHPPGDHAGAALLSGVMVADLLRQTGYRARRREREHPALET